MAQELPDLAPQQRQRPNPSSSFRAQFNLEKEEGSVGGVIGGPDVAYYFPEDASRRYFTEERVQQIYTEIYPEQHQSGNVQMHEAFDIRRRYRKILAILLYIRRGALLNAFLSDPNLDDKHLPFWGPFEHFPGNDEDFKLFYEAQWSFSVRSMKYRHISAWHPRQILPFKSLGKLGGGHGGQAYLIEIQPSLNKLDPSFLSSNNDSGSTLNVPDNVQGNLPNPNIFVLKLFHQRGSSREKWLSEAKSHVAVRTNSDLSKDGGIINFHGCFSHGSAFVILLEHAPWGNLEQLFQKGKRPKELLDILDLWDSYLRLLSTLKCLRRFENAQGGVLQMCHFDIKPNNILVFPGASGRPFDLRFKLGDLGSSVHSPLLDEHPDGAAYALQKQGTRTYGAPECCRIDPHSNLALLPPNYVQPHADLWSYGCVASELATWISRGKGGLKAYREGRKDNHDTTWADEDCFHNGYQTLPWIRTHHERLDQDLKADPCNATVAVLQMIDAEMLQFEPKRRTDPGTLMHKARSMMNQIRKNIEQQDASTGPNLCAVAYEAPTIGSSASPTNGSGEGRSAFRPSGSDSKPIAGMVYDIVSAPSSIKPRGTEFGRRSNSVQPAELNLTHVRRERFNATGPEPGDRHSAAEMQHGARRPPQRQRALSGTEASNVHMGTHDALRARPTLPLRPQGFQPENIYGGVGSHEPRDRVVPVLENIHESQPFVEEPDTYGEQPNTSQSAIESPGQDSNFNAPISRSSGVPGVSQREQIPFLDVTQALLWLYMTRSQSLWSKIRGKEDKTYEPYWRQLSQDFEDRDFRILIDDSHSMSKYWDDVEKCASLLAFCTTRFDDDGIDLSFMFSNKEKNTKGYKSISKLVQGNRPPEHHTGSSQLNQKNNINAVLGKILREYQRKIRAYAPHPKKLVLFVLTDGDWLPHSDAREPLRDLAKAIEKHELPQNQVGVQFIRFGNSKHGSKRLSDLDDFLPTDIVDVEGWTHGNVWKMLLGSINKDFDWAETPNSMSERSESPIPVDSSAVLSRSQDPFNTTPSPLSHGYVSHPSLSPVTHNGSEVQSPTRGAAGHGPYQRASHASRPSYTAGGYF